MNAYLAAIRRAPPWFGRLMLADIGWNFAFGVIWVGYNLYLASLGHGDKVAGYAQTWGSAANMMSAFFVGRLIDRKGAGRMFSLAMMLFGVGIAWRGLAAEELWIYVAAFAAGALSNLAWFVVDPLVAMGDQQDANRRFSLIFAAATIAVAAGSWVGGHLPGQVAAWRAGPGAAIESADYRVVFLLAAAVLPVSALIAWPLRHVHHADGADKPLPDEPEPLAGREPPLHWKALLLANNSAVLKYWLTLLPVALGAGLSVPFMNLYLKNRHLLSDARIGDAFTIQNLVVVGAYMLAPVLARRLGTVRGLVLLEAASLPFLLMLAFTGSAKVAIVAFVARGALMNASHPLRQRVLMELVPGSSRGAAGSLAGIVWGFGWLVGPWVGGRWIESTRAAVGEAGAYTWPFVVTAGLYLMAVVGFWAWFRDRKLREEIYADPSDTLIQD